MIAVALARCSRRARPQRMMSRPRSSSWHSQGARVKTEGAARRRDPGVAVAALATAAWCWGCSGPAHNGAVLAAPARRRSGRVSRTARFLAGGRWPQSTVGTSVRRRGRRRPRVKRSRTAPPVFSLDHEQWETASSRSHRLDSGSSSGAGVAAHGHPRSRTKMPGAQGVFAFNLATSRSTAVAAFAVSDAEAVTPRNAD